MMSEIPAQHQDHHRDRHPAHRTFTETVLPPATESTRRKAVDYTLAGLRQPGGVQLRDDGASPMAADLLGGLLGALLVGVPGDPDVQAGLRQGDGGGAADAGIGSGDDGGAGLELVDDAHGMSSRGVMLGVRGVLLPIQPHPALLHPT